jgi:hypothetical protein
VRACRPTWRGAGARRSQVHCRKIGRAQHAAAIALSENARHGSEGLSLSGGASGWSLVLLQAEHHLCGWSFRATKRATQLGRPRRLSVAMRICRLAHLPPSEGVGVVADAHESDDGRAKAGAAGAARRGGPGRFRAGVPGGCVEEESHSRDDRSSRIEQRPNVRKGDTTNFCDV